MKRYNWIWLVMSMCLWIVFAGYSLIELSVNTARIFLNKEDLETVYVIWHYVLILMSTRIIKKSDILHVRMVPSVWSVLILILILLGFYYESYSKWIGGFIMWIGASAAATTVTVSMFIKCEQAYDSLILRFCSSHAWTLSQKPPISGVFYMPRV